MEKKLLMVLGPVEVEEDILKISSEPMDYMRTPDYSSKWEKIFKGLKYAFQTKNEIAVLASSGTGAMDGCISNFLNKNDKALYINGGTFGKRWGDICSIYNINAVEIPVEFGKSVEIEKIEENLQKNPDTKALLATLNETSSGALTDIEAIGEVLKNYPKVLFIVDCISGLLTNKFKQDEWRVDVAISASQKAFALPPGLAFISANEKALEFAKKSDLKSFYFNIFDYIENAKRNQTPFTPAVSIVNQLEKRLEKIQKEGLDAYQKRYEELTLYLRENLQKLGFNILAQNPVNCVSAIYCENYDASEIVSIMRKKYHIEIAPSGGELKTKLFRVGNYGNIKKNDIDSFLDSLKKTINELRG